MTISIARLKITLDDVEPVVMRRIKMPFDIRLDRLHLMLQTALGWTNSHLYEFCIKNIGFGMPNPTWGDGPLDVRKATLLSAVEDTGAKSFRYLYDFGEGWEHSVKIERIAPALPGLDPLSLIDATGACPPEDIDGPWGYQEFIEALADPGHERHEELVEW
ncbi:pRiA4b ORF-3-like protein [Rhizobium sp. RU35A]|uniref:plasmid pRiA4b ORF-3 family protein n=1 Tax=Rhizobium sp. RU35A TaxID=1907414 RepID=UPI000955F902|nr:plasmid pRiA4b ORF-3 family protein [Rhizobium sp. RU35A]SIR39907.1 pRiA4b ORF-3-like protein [Rhizobium sp. RU35A]